MTCVLQASLLQKLVGCLCRALGLLVVTLSGSKGGFPPPRGSPVLGGAPAAGRSPVAWSVCGHRWLSVGAIPWVPALGLRTRSPLADWRCLPSPDFLRRTEVLTVHCSCFVTRLLSASSSSWFVTGLPSWRGNRATWGLGLALRAGGGGCRAEQPGIRAPGRQGASPRELSFGSWEDWFILSHFTCFKFAFARRVK